MCVVIPKCILSVFLHRKGEFWRWIHPWAMYTIYHCCRLSSKSVEGQVMHFLARGKPIKLCILIIVVEVKQCRFSEVHKEITETIIKILKDRDYSPSSEPFQL